MTFWMRMFLAAPASAAIALAAYKKGSLSRSGGGAAVLLGALMAALGGWRSWSLMIAFFLLAALAGKAAKRSRGGPKGEEEHSGPRGARQVVANGGPALIAAAVSFLLKRPELLTAMAAAFAEAAADTCASELGVLSRRPPISLRTLAPAKPGSSGAISALGTGMSLLGALAIGALDAWIGHGSAKEFGLVVVAGFLGALADSLLGATIQAKYRCTVCGRTVEKPVHHDRSALPLSGWRFCGNNMVNALSGLFSAALAAALLPLIR